jgi:serine/threonine-protein kinase HipA
MSCKGCYSEGTDGYCLPCRKKLFNGAKVPAVLDFDTPKAGNLEAFQEHSRGMSISGVQLKYSLRLENKKLALTEKGGEYILKPIPPNRQLLVAENVPENEHLTMQVAARVFGIGTAANALIFFRDGSPAYITRRFDVKPDGTKYLQEDFAQLTNRTKATHGETFKYDGSYEEIGLMIRKFVPAAIPALERFFRLVVFNYVISNGDAHLKNFSLTRSDEGEYLFAPAYDLVSTVLHTPTESDTALDLYKGDTDTPFYSAHGYYGRPEFMELARRLSLNPNRAARILDTMNEGYNHLTTLVSASLLPTNLKTAYTQNVKDKLARIRKVSSEW